MAKTSEVIREVYAQHPDWRPVDIAAEVARRTGKPCTSPQVASALKSKKAQAAQPSGLYQAPAKKEEPAPVIRSGTAGASKEAGHGILDAVDAARQLLTLVSAEDAKGLIDRLG